MNAIDLGMKNSFFGISLFSKQIFFIMHFLNSIFIKYNMIHNVTGPTGVECGVA